MGTFRWRSLSSLDGSERSFRERLRVPDEGFSRLLMTLSVFLPIGFGIIMMPLMVLPRLIEAFLGPQSWITYYLSWVSSYVIEFGLYILVLTFFGMYGLRAYVAVKLRRHKKV